MKLCSFLMIFYIFSLSVFSFGRIRSPSEYPQTTWVYNQVLSRNISFSIPIKKYKEEATTRFDEERAYTEVDLKHSFRVKGGFGVGFEIEVPHRRWLNFGFSLRIMGNSPKGGFEGMFSYKGGRLGTRLQFFSRLQYPMRFSSFTINPNVKVGLGLGGGVEMWEYDVKINDGFASASVFLPLGVSLGSDFYWGKWFALTLGLQYVIEPGLDFIQNATNKDVTGLGKVFNTELALIFGIKSTYF